MAEPFLSELSALIDAMAQRQKQMNGVTCKHFFSGAAAYIQGQIFMSVSPAGLALKLPDDKLNTVLDLGGKPLKYFPKSPIKKGYAVLSPHTREDSKTLYHLIDISINHVLDRATKDMVSKK